MVMEAIHELFAQEVERICVRREGIVCVVDWRECGCRVWWLKMVSRPW